MFDQLREAAFSVAGSVTSVLSSKAEGAIKKTSYDEESAQNIQVKEPSLFWASVMSAPIWEQKKEAARQQLKLESKEMRLCHGCNASGVEIVHGRFCGENSHKVGMGITLLHAVKASNYELVNLVRDLSLSTSPSYQGYLSPEYLIRAALLAVEHGSYDIVLLFGFEWLTGITDVAYLSENHEKAYLRYVQKVLERVFSVSSIVSDDEGEDEVKNLGNINLLLSCLLPTKAKNREIFRKFQPAIDTHLQQNLLRIVGCGVSTYKIRQLLINDYGILFHPRVRPADSDNVMTDLAAKILEEGKEFFEVRQRRWLRSAMTERSIHQFVLKLLVKMKGEIMAERRPFGEKLIIRCNLSEATGTAVILPTRSEEFWNSIIRCKKALGCCPRISRRERLDSEEDGSAMESLLAGMDERSGRDESVF
jgi:hypothetical protein